MACLPRPSSSGIDFREIRSSFFKSQPKGGSSSPKHGDADPVPVVAWWPHLARCSCHLPTPQSGRVRRRLPKSQRSETCLCQGQRRAHLATAAQEPPQLNSRGSSHWLPAGCQPECRGVQKLLASPLQSSPRKEVQIRAGRSLRRHVATPSAPQDLQKTNTNNGFKSSFAILEYAEQSTHSHRQQ